MNTLETLKTVVKEMNEFERRVYVSYWLEDINFHSENSMICEKFTEKEKERVNMLEKLALCASYSFFSKSHWDSMKTYGYIDDKFIAQYTSWQEEDFRNSFEHTTITKECISKFKTAQRHEAMIALWGWGVCNDSWKNKEQFVRDVEEIIITDLPPVPEYSNYN